MSVEEKLQIEALTTAVREQTAASQNLNETLLGNAKTPGLFERIRRLESRQGIVWGGITLACCAALTTFVRMWMMSG